MVLESNNCQKDSEADDVLENLAETGNWSLHIGQKALSKEVMCDLGVKWEQGARCVTIHKQL